MTSKEALREYFKSLTREEKQRMQVKLMTGLEISMYTLNNWRYAGTRILPLYRREITKIIGKDIFKNVTD